MTGVLLYRKAERLDAHTHHFLTRDPLSASVLLLKYGHLEQVETRRHLHPAGGAYRDWWHGNMKWLGDFSLRTEVDA